MTSRETPPVGKPITPPADRREALIQEAVQEGIAVALSKSVWEDIAAQVRGEYNGTGMTDLRAAIRKAVRTELRKAAGGPRTDE